MGDDPLTLVTPPPPVAAIVIEPVLLVMEMPVPADKVALVSVLPVELPISNCPLVYVVCPVPPLATATVPVTFAAVPVVFWLRVGKSPAAAMDNAPVVVVDFKIPVLRAEVPAE